MSKQEQKDEAFKIYQEAIALAVKNYQDAIAPAFKIYQEAVALAEKNNQEAEQEDETIKIIEGKKYQLIK